MKYFTLLLPFIALLAAAAKIAGADKSPRILGVKPPQLAADHTAGQRED